MPQQNQQSGKDLQCSQIKLQTPKGSKIVKRKINQLQNKAYFFQGQLNPLFQENEKLKAHLIALNKTVMNSTEILRGLLPVGNSEAKKLKLQLANLQQISVMIKDDWHEMQINIERKDFALDVMDKKLISNTLELNQKHELFKRQVEVIISEKDSIIKEIKEKLRQTQARFAEVQAKCLKEVEDIKESYKFKIERAEKLQKEFEIFRHQVRNRYMNYDSTVNRLKDQIAKNVVQFQESKKNLREIYDKLMKDKLEQQAESFNMLLRTKEEEKDRLMIYYQQKEQQMQKIIEENNISIGKLTQANFLQKKQFEKQSDELYAKKNEIQSLNRQIREKEQALYKTSQQHKSLLKKLSNISSEFEKKEKQYMQAIKDQQKSYEQAHKTLADKINSLTHINQKLEQDLESKIGKLRTTEKSLVTAQRRFNEQLKAKQEQWIAQKKELEQQKTRLYDIIQTKDDQIAYKQLQFANIVKQHQQKVLCIQRQNRKQIQQVQKIHQKQIQEYKSGQEQVLKQLKKSHDRLLAAQKCKLNEEMQQLMIQCQSKIRKTEEEFKKLQGSLNQQITKKNSELLNKENELSIMQDKIKVIDKEMYDMKVQNNLKINTLKQQAQVKLRQLESDKENEKRKIQNEMVGQLQMMQEQMDQKTSEYEQKISKIKTEMMEEIKLLKSSSALEQMQNKFIAQMNKIKTQHEQNILQIEEKQKESQQTLIDQQKMKIQQLINQYEEDMSKLATKLQSDIGKLNDELLNEQHLHEITKMTRQQKIEYLCGKIHNLRTESEQRQVKILELEIQINKYKKQFEKIDQIIEEKVKAKKEQMQLKTRQYDQQCQKAIQRHSKQAQMRISHVQRDRLSFSQNMYDQFNKIKEYHAQQMQKWQTKYHQLETLFSERPSRAQDLSKIKELIQLKEKMNIEVSSCQKKVDQANQIVKYLNLQLENYKDTYDIFGPNEESKDCSSTDNKIIIMDRQGSPIQKSKRNFVRYQMANQKINTEGQELQQDNRQSVLRKDGTGKNVQIQVESNEYKLLPPIRRQSEGYISLQSPIKKNKFLPSTLSNSKKLMPISDKSEEIMMNAENFLSIIRENQQNQSDPPVVRGNPKNNEKKAYRKSKRSRLVTVGGTISQQFSFIKKRSLQIADMYQG